MTQATYSIRLDRDKKAKFDEICNRLGLSASAAFSTFVNKTIEKRGLPYELTLEKPQPITVSSKPTSSLMKSSWRKFRRELTPPRMVKSIPKLRSSAIFSGRIMRKYKIAYSNEAKKDIQSIFSFIKSISSEQNAKKPRHHHFQTFRLRERLKIETLWLPGLVASFC
ncbi:type II toxin-antitoxin system RelB/DinJ family antitoxin [Candidatus Saccharibacteria bacterium]|nr:type II toxin-antitoxin system RelB/DinJ family antitoxin [Candidatus Saccharibacteria bacterium]